LTFLGCEDLFGSNLGYLMELMSIVRTIWIYLLLNGHEFFPQEYKLKNFCLNNDHCALFVS